MSIPTRVADVIVESLRAGEVPQEGLEHFATGIETHAAAVERDLLRIADRRGRYLCPRLSRLRSRPGAGPPAVDCGG